jgi:type IV fimbrial biogenesis protein FimT
MRVATKLPRGFTLPELLTTLAVSGLALGLAVPGLKSVTQGQRDASAINSLVGTLHLARSAAMTRNEPVTICASNDGLHCTDTAWEQGWVVFVDPSMARQPGPDGLLAGEHGLPEPLRLESPEFARSLTYRPNGQPVGGPGASVSGAFWFCADASEADARGLWINATGKPQLVDRQANGRPFVCPG